MEYFRFSMDKLKLWVVPQHVQMWFSILAFSHFWAVLVSIYSALEFHSCGNSVYSGSQTFSFLLVIILNGSKVIRLLNKQQPPCWGVMRFLQLPQLLIPAYWLFQLQWCLPLPSSGLSRNLLRSFYNVSIRFGITFLSRTWFISLSVL